MQNSTKTQRKPFFKFVKMILKIFKRKPKFINLGDSLDDASIYLCNHSGASGPITIELYFPKNFKFWGTFEMCGGIKSRWNYLYRNYFFKKKHNSKFLSFLKSTIIAPFIGMFYKGMQLIPTYTNHKMVKTINYSLNFLNNNNNIFIFPENSSDGYHDVLKEYYGGFYLLARKFYERFKKDIKIYNMYFKKKKNIIVIDKPVLVSELIAKNLSYRDMTEMFRKRANELSSVLKL